MAATASVTLRCDACADGRAQIRVTVTSTLVSVELPSRWGSAAVYGEDHERVGHQLLCAECVRDVLSAARLEVP
jgi:hypothetical protein